MAVAVAHLERNLASLVMSPDANPYVAWPSKKSFSFVNGKAQAVIANLHYLNQEKHR